MGEFINAEEQFKNKAEIAKSVEADIENILKLSPHYEGMEEDEKKILINRIVDYIEDKEEKKAA